MCGIKDTLSHGLMLQLELCKLRLLYFSSGSGVIGSSPPPLSKGRNIAPGGGQKILGISPPGGEYPRNIARL